MLKKTLVSVVMSVYNAEKYLNEAIESILKQTFEDFEFIIINDGSTDSSLKIIKSYKDDRIVVIDQENKGLARALNNGIKQSKSDYILRMDADDISLPERIKKQYSFLKKNPDYIAVGSNAIIIDAMGNYVHTSHQCTSDTKAKEKLPVTPFMHSSVMFKKKPFIMAGEYCEDMIKAQDTVLFNRMAKYGKFLNIDDVLIKYRIVPTANSIRSLKNRKKFKKIIEEAIETNKVSKENSIFLQSVLAKRYSVEKISTYHIHLAKKYLWNNYQPKLARKNLKSSFRIKPNIYSLILYIFSFVPNKTINVVYNNYYENRNINR